MSLRTIRLVTSALAVGGLAIIGQGCGSSGGAAAGSDGGTDAASGHHRDSGSTADSGKPGDSSVHADTGQHDAATHDSSAHDSGQGSDGTMPATDSGLDGASSADSGHDGGAHTDAGNDAAGGAFDSGTLDLSTLSFAILGGTRPATQDDTAAYPTAVITKIWQDIQAASPRPAFAIDTGEYMFASPTHTPGTQATQLADFMTARANFTNPLFPAMSNQECDGAIGDNCYACGAACTTVGGTCVGGTCTTPNLTDFTSTLLAPIRETLPYYTMNTSGPSNAWTAKFVFVACNAWSPTQATWLGTELSVATTYTFVVRNEDTTATTAPCLSGTGMNNADTIMAAYPYTLLIAGHTHTYAYYSSEKQVVVGNGGAPLSGAVDYGYVIARQQANGSIVFTEYDYTTNAAGSTFTVQ